MAGDSSRDKFSLEGSRLAVRGELHMEDGSELAAALRQLLSTGHDSLTVDLGEVEAIRSSCIGLIMQALQDARRKDAAVTILARPGVAFLLDSVGAGMFAEVQVIEGE